MKNLIFALVFFLISCNSQSQNNESKSLQNSATSKQKAELYKSFLNYEYNADTTLTKFEDIFGEWEFSHIGGEPSELDLNKIVENDSLVLVSPLVINQNTCYQLGYIPKQDNPVYKLDKFDANDANEDFRGTTFFCGYALNRKVVAFLWINKNRRFEVIDKDVIAYRVGLLGRNYFYFYRRKK
jgi:hypothetical protein